MALDKYEGADNINSIEGAVTDSLAEELRETAMAAEKTRRREALAALGDDTYAEGTVIRFVIPKVKNGGKTAGTYLAVKTDNGTWYAYLTSTYNYANSYQWDDFRGWLLSYQGFADFQVIYTPPTPEAPVSE